jgi:hypothetical protein
MTDNDSWQQQLAFASGYILVFGIALLKLWPLAAGIQTGMNVNFWTADFPSQGVKVELIEFWALTFVLGIAFTAIVLAVAHILCHGLALAFSTNADSHPLVIAASNKLDQLRRITYRAAFLLLPYLGLLIALDICLLISAGLENTLVSRFHLSMKAAGWTSRSLVTAAFLVTFLYGFYKLLPYLFSEKKSSRIGGAAHGFFLFSGTGALLTMMGVLVVQTCFTANMNVAGQVFQKSRNDLIEVRLDLGGATSAVALAQLTLADSRGTPLRSLSPQDLGEGHYISTIQSRDLPDGRYQVTLEYPHLSVSSLFPFLHKHIVSQRWFLVMSS